MEYLNRNITPRVLYKQVAGEHLFLRKGKRWKIRYDANNGSVFSWGNIMFDGRNIDLSKELSLLLQNISNERCQYCDRKQVRKGDIRPTIDHFAPKTKHPLKAYYWPNLFLACDSCQEYKSSKFSRKYLLKFDNDDYCFDDYFNFDFASGRVLTRLDISPLHRCKARYTLLILGINSDRRMESRIEELRAFEATNIPLREIENFNFRYFISRSFPQ